jgi:hypothetical protein
MPDPKAPKFCDFYLTTALRFCCSLLVCYYGFLKPFWTWPHLNLLFVLKKLIPWWRDETMEISTHCALFIIGCEPVTVMNVNVTNPDALSRIRPRSQSLYANAFLRYQEICLDGKRLVDLGQELVGWTCDESVGSWFTASGRQEAAAGRRLTF